MPDSATREKILRFAKASYNTEPEYLWLSSPDSAVLRRADSKKWFGIIMRVLKERLGIEGEGSAEVLNIKCSPVLIGSLLKNPGYLPAYHMSKVSWISIVLDGSVPEEEAESLLSMSYGLVAPPKKTEHKK